MAASSIAPLPYDIFLSFSGVDTRKTFTGHLTEALSHRGFNVFHDSKLRRGYGIDTELSKAIEESRISIVVFSKNYASSRWCLDELLQIVDCHKIVIPVFYDVEPSDIRKQSGVYAEAFVDHEKNFDADRIKKWREALTKAANLSGKHLHNDAGGHEAKFVAQIVEEIANRLNPSTLEVASFPVGITSRVQELDSLLSLGTKDVRIVAIWGVGGIGKTTIAKAVFNRIVTKFEGSSFLADIRGTSRQASGMVTLQKQLISNVLLNDTLNIDNIHQGIMVVKQRIWSQRVLVVLDDVDNVEQLEALAINRAFFRPGSRIIVTTRDLSCVDSIQVDAVYQPKELDKSQSLKLFSCYAFGKDHPIEGFEELSKEVVNYAGGLPLVLRILGSFMTSNLSKSAWQEELKRLKKIPHDDVHGKLKVSFDALSNEEKSLFLDIACFLIGMNKDFAVKILGSETYPEIGIEMLVRRCLVSINVFRELSMHDMVRDMGREIVRRESLKEPGKRSRLWDYEDVLSVLRNCSGTEAVETLLLELPVSNREKVHVDAFKNMNRLRFLHVDNLHGGGASVPSSNNLKWLYWHGYPSKSIPSKLFMGNVVAIDLQHSKITHLWSGKKGLNNLRFLNLSYSYSLTKITDLSGLLRLEEFLLRDCLNLVKVHKSVRSLRSLRVLDMSNCRSLTVLPLGDLRWKTGCKIDISGTPVQDFFSNPRRSRHASIKDKILAELKCIVMIISG